MAGLVEAWMKVSVKYKDDPDVMLIIDALSSALERKQELQAVFDRIRKKPTYTQVESSVKCKLAEYDLEQARETIDSLAEQLSKYQQPK